MCECELFLTGYLVASTWGVVVVGGEKSVACEEGLLSKGHWAVQLRTKVKEWTSDSRPQHKDGEVSRRTTHHPRFELDESGVT